MSQNTIKTWQQEVGSEPVSYEEQIPYMQSEIKALRARVAELEAMVSDQAAIIKSSVEAIETLHKMRLAVPAALTDGDIEAYAERMEASDPTDPFWKEFARHIEQHLMSGANNLLAAGQGKDSERLDWMIANRMMRVQGSDDSGWCVLDCSNGLVFVVHDAATARKAIDAAMKAGAQGDKA